MVCRLSFPLVSLCRIFFTVSFTAGFFNYINRDLKAYSSPFTVELDVRFHAMLQSENIHALIARLKLQMSRAISHGYIVAIVVILLQYFN